MRQSWDTRPQRCRARSTVSWSQSWMRMFWYSPLGCRPELSTERGHNAARGGPGTSGRGAT
eukprot:3820948-Alexandrium_andersonii.AAC.1